MSDIIKKRRERNYLSASSLAKYLSDPRQFYREYLAKVPREPQTAPMAMGSAFDAFIKHQLTRVFKAKVEHGVHDVDAELNKQVRAALIPEVKVKAQDLFERYKKCGAYNALFDLLCKADVIRMECRRIIKIGGVPVMIVPDLEFRIQGVWYVLDFKVNGSMSGRMLTPEKGYINLRNASDKQMRIVHIHKDAVVTRCPHHINTYMDYSRRLMQSQWAMQLKTYAYTHLEVQPIVAVEQLCGAPEHLRVASHMCYAGDEWVPELETLYQQLWSLIQSEHFFPELSLDESIKLEEEIQQVSDMFNQPNMAWFKDLMGDG